MSKKSVLPKSATSTIRRILALCILLAIALCGCGKDTASNIAELDVSIGASSSAAKFTFAGTDDKSEEVHLRAEDVVTVTVNFEITSEDRYSNGVASYKLQAAYPYKVAKGEQGTLMFQLENKATGKIYQKSLSFIADNNLTIGLGTGNGAMIEPEDTNSNQEGKHKVNFSFYCNSPDHARIVEGSIKLDHVSRLNYLIGVEAKADEYASDWCANCGHESTSPYCVEYISKQAEALLPRQDELGPTPPASSATLPPEPPLLGELPTTKDSSTPSETP